MNFVDTVNLTSTISKDTRFEFKTITEFEFIKNPKEILSMYIDLNGINNIDKMVINILILKKVKKI